MDATAESVGMWVQIPHAAADIFTARALTTAL